MATPRSLVNNEFIVTNNYGVISFYYQADYNALVMIETLEKGKYNCRYIHMSDKHDEQKGFKTINDYNPQFFLKGPLGHTPNWDCTILEEKSVTSLSQRLNNQAKRATFPSQKTSIDKMVNILMKQKEIFNEDIAQSIQTAYKEATGESIVLADRCETIRSKGVCCSIL